MDLLLMRHAKADERSIIKYPDDDLRPLTLEGQKIHRQVSQTLYKLYSGKIDKIFTSPLVRARETAEISTEQFSLQKNLFETDLLGNSFDCGALTQFLRGQCAQDERVFLVGHEPDLSHLSSYYLSRGLYINFKKSAVLVISFAGHPEKGGGMLKAFYRPKDMVRLAK